VKNYETKVDKSRGKKVRLRLKDYVAVFVHAYRDQVDRLQEKEKAFFGEYVEEQSLSKPCQVEVFDFSEPCRLILIFILDKTKPDLVCTVQKEDWRNIDNVVERLRTKYGELELSRFGIRRMLVRFHNMNQKCMYSLDVVKGVLGICFPINIRLNEWPLARWSGVETSPQEVAKIVYGLNRSQAVDEYLAPEILAEAVRQLKKKGFTLVEAFFQRGQQ